MNRFVKKNIVLIGILTGSAILALGLLIYAVIVVIDVNRYLSRTEKARDTIRNLVKQKPAPGLENEKRILNDIDLYKESTQNLQSHFRSPLQPAVDAFIAELPPPRLTGEEAENYKVPETGETDEEGKVTKPLEIRKLTLEEFKSLLKSRYDLYTADMSDEIKNGIDAQTSFIEDFSRLFVPNGTNTGSWNKAVQAFVAKAKNLTLEPIDRSNQIALLLNAMGFSRRVNSQATMFSEHMSSFSNALTSAAGEMEIVPAAMDFLISTRNTMGGGSNIQIVPRDFAKVLFHWDVFGDVVKRFSAAKIKQILKIYARKYAAGETQEGPDKVQTLGTFFEQIGNFKVYHYTIEVVGSMDSLRKAVKEIDEAYKQNRIYVVRAVYLYEDNDSAGTFMGRSQPTQQQNIDNSMPDNPDNSRMLRRRRRRVDPAMMPREENAEVKNKRSEQERIMAAEAKLPINERSNYGAILIGGKEDFRAFIDIDYVVLEQEQ